MTSNSKDQLTAILKGDLKGIKKPNPVVIDGSKIRNKVLRNLVKNERTKGTKDYEIINKILNYDELVELGKITQAQFNK
ncbi:MAG TPA: hypothetical protein PKU95_00140 [Candidatus Dojkabacteria bacterium]|nr:hypothetical protein [Candidatus Dojkabacteria bacterium]